MPTTPSRAQKVRVFLQWLVCLLWASLLLLLPWVPVLNRFINLGPPDSTTVDDTKAIPFAKSARIIDNTVTIPDPPNVTADPHYARLVNSIRYLRGRLIQDQVLRKPLLEILRGLYESPKSSKNISRIHPTKPTDQDIICFVDEFWPDLYLVRPTLRKSRVNLGGRGQWDCTWGHTFAGVTAVPNAQVQIIEPLIDQWVSKNTLSSFDDPPVDLTPEALCWFTMAVLAHEAAHRMVVWWSLGECDTPEMDGIEKEAGNFLEKAWFGGVTVVEFPKGKVGVFNKILSVGIEIDNLYYPIDVQLANELQEMNTSNGLPFFHPHALPPSINPNTVRVKAAQYATDGEQFQIDIPILNPTQSAGPSTTMLNVPVETELWRHLKNDKIPYEDRFLYVYGD